MMKMQDNIFYNNLKFCLPLHKLILLALFIYFLVTWYEKHFLIAIATCIYFASQMETATHSFDFSKMLFPIQTSNSEARRKHQFYFARILLFFASWVISASPSSSISGGI